MWAERSAKWKERAKLRTKAELKEAILNVLQANKGHIISAQELHKALPARKGEFEAFREAFHELIKEGKIKQYMSLP
jgi:deoxyribodipyrimidine photolyase